MGLEVGLFGLILLLICVWAILQIAQSHASTLAKALWIVALLIFPVFGFVAWLIFGPRANR
ncbi:Phospholipase_D-nuclease N-terminal [Tistlia consotensis]|uniref:Phospholipase_D-nuclease N-terminal n=1 Tax=Tistlia consotensis USBA 355 TaxID=560819 RepID=A0A1Y6CN20_9PROT|nr:PLD nuclease N-terminal domain-containing protein [Tistlia consotensis]SMF60975.1 Phospholipase_D-nuclease N-terminal [Tistlia consotensis USBA 355]SNR92303.1 Phospholipase_D-nuclease N-terminal [Tistlia consotensis]